MVDSSMVAEGRKVKWARKTTLQSLQVLVAEAPVYVAEAPIYVGEAPIYVGEALPDR